MADHRAGVRPHPSNCMNRWPFSGPLISALGIGRTIRQITLPAFFEFLASDSSSTRQETYSRPPY